MALSLLSLTLFKYEFTETWRRRETERELTKNTVLKYFALHMVNGCLSPTTANVNISHGRKAKRKHQKSLEQSHTHTHTLFRRCVSAVSQFSRWKRVIEGARIFINYNDATVAAVVVTNSFTTATQLGAQSARR